MRSLLFYALFLSIVFCTGCKNNNSKIVENVTQNIANKLDSSQVTKVLNLEKLLAQAEVPVLCYHHIRPFASGKSLRMKEYELSPASFAEQMKILADSGFHTILPDQLYDYLTKGTQLPTKPVMITYDDTSVEHFLIGKSEMDKHGFKGVFFIMTIAIGKKNYMSREQIKQLADEGHTVACHTWDHHKVTEYDDATWDIQTQKAGKLLEDVTGKKVSYFAYPFGIWDQKAIPALKARDYKMAFILSTPRDSVQPLHTIRRMIVPGTWSAQGMLKVMKTTFD